MAFRPHPALRRTVSQRAPSRPPRREKFEESVRAVARAAATRAWAAPSCCGDDVMSCACAPSIGHRGARCPSRAATIAGTTNCFRSLRGSGSVDPVGVRERRSIRARSSRRAQRRREYRATTRATSTRDELGRDAANQGRGTRVRDRLCSRPRTPNTQSSRPCGSAAASPARWNPAGMKSASRRPDSTSSSSVQSTGTVRVGSVWSSRESCRGDRDHVSSALPRSAGPFGGTAS